MARPSTQAFDTGGGRSHEQSNYCSYPTSGVRQRALGLRRGPQVDDHPVLAVD
jgi:hypothetical protein